MTYFVPDDRDFEIWSAGVANTTHLPKVLRVFGYAEFCFWDALKDQQNVDWVQQINQGRYANGVITWHPHHEAASCAFFATGEPVHSFDTNLEAFIGNYRCAANPIAVELGACTGSISYRRNGVGALCLELALARGEEREVVFILGFAEDKAQLRDEIAPYLKPAAAHDALARLKESWQSFTKHFTVATPDEETGLPLNTWNQYQGNTTFNWSRFVSLYQLGLGRGMGFRDSAQDVLGVSHAIPQKVNKTTEGTVLEHLQRALAFTAAHRGPHGLALIGRADWSDALNLDLGQGRAESVFTSMLYCRALLEMDELLGHLGRREEAARYRGEHAEMGRLINGSGWDGEWYLRAFDDDGNPLGSRACRHGKIFINSQSWAVLSGVAPRERAESALAAAERYLQTEHGLVAVYAAFDGALGGITTYPPGAKENGGIFVQTNPWIVIAQAMLGRGEQAYQCYRQTLPSKHNEAAERFEVEPYVYPQNILGKEHPQFGVGRNSWLTGAASWHFVAATQYILGIRPEYDGLTIDPCLPPAWDGFKATRVFRGGDLPHRSREPDARE